MEMLNIPTDGTQWFEVLCGTPLFPFGYRIDHFKDLNESAIGWHWHDAFEFALVVSGSIIFNVGEETINIGEGNMLFVNSGAVHSVTSADKGATRQVAFSPEFLAAKESAIFEKFVRPIAESHCEYVIIGIKDQEQTRLKELLMTVFTEAAGNDSERELAIHINVMVLWKEFFKFLKSRDEEDPRELMTKKIDRARFHAMLDYIHSNYQNSIALEDIAASAGISPSSAVRCFRTCVGSTPVCFLNGFRLELAKSLIESTSNSISDISQSVGFDSSGYFCKCYRKKYGISPGSYRKRP